MDTEVMIAVITASVSLIVALVSLISTIISNRQNRKTAAGIESLKYEFTNRRETKELSDKYLNKSIESLGCLIQAIQRVKDILQLIVSAPDDSLDSETAMGLISEARESLFTCYEDHLAHLGNESSEYAHKAKNRTLTVEQHIRLWLKDESITSALSDEEKDTLRESRLFLSDMQNVLRDKRTGIMYERIGVNSGEDS